MKKEFTVFKENMQVLGRQYPGLADRIMALPVPGHYSVLQSKSGHPVLKALNVTFHSLYDPVKEGRQFVEVHLKDGNVKAGDTVRIFGLGFAYHIMPLIDKGIRARIIEPRIEILRIAMEYIDLTGILETMELCAGCDSGTDCRDDSLLWAHQPSVKFSRQAFDQLSDSSSRPDRTRGTKSSGLPLRNSLKILVVTPIYGGSLPIAKNCYHALKNAGHDVQLWDASIYEQPFRNALELNLEDRNRIVLYDLFLHLMSEVIIAVCSDFRPDLVLALAQSPISIEALKRLRQNNITSAFWFVEDYQYMDYWKKYAPHYDFYFAIQDGAFFRELEKIGVRNYHYLPMAANPQIHCPLDLSRQDSREFGSDISFMGAGYYNREKMFHGLLDYDFKIWGNEWNDLSHVWKHVQREGQRLSTADTVKVFNATGININLHSSVCHEGVDPFGDFVNPRTFEIASCGAFQLADCRANLERHFSPETEIICYKNLEDLRGKIDFYLKRPELRRRIASGARQRVLNEHTYEHRMRELLCFIKERKPECFYSRPDSAPVVQDIDSFCKTYPEAAGVVQAAAGREGRTDINQIAAAILSGSGSLSYHDAAFLMIKEFQELIQGCSA